jgi:hypothetical protein
MKRLVLIVLVLSVVAGALMTGTALAKPAKKQETRLMSDRQFDYGPPYQTVLSTTTGDATIGGKLFVRRWIGYSASWRWDRLAGTVELVRFDTTTGRWVKQAQQYTANGAVAFKVRKRGVYLVRYLGNQWTWGSGFQEPVYQDGVTVTLLPDSESSDASGNVFVELQARVTTPDDVTFTASPYSNLFFGSPSILYGALSIASSETPSPSFLGGLVQSPVGLTIQKLTHQGVYKFTFTVPASQKDEVFVWSAGALIGNDTLLPGYSQSPTFTLSPTRPAPPNARPTASPKASAAQVDQVKARAAQFGIR